MANQNNNKNNSAADRKAARRKRQKQALILKAGILVLLVAILIVCIVLAAKLRGEEKGSNNSPKPQVTENGRAEEGTGGAGENGESDPQDIPTATGDKATIMEQARVMAMGYDYDGAIALLQTIQGFDSDADVTAAIAEYTATKASCVAVDTDKVPHIFYHSLVNDTNRAFSVSALGQSQADGMNAWMTTVEEFDKITQQMYDNGYVFVRMRDLVVETTDENGNVHFTKNTNLLLPQGKKPVVLSIDDLCYYHSYDKAGYPSKMVIDENGKVKCEYTDASGNTSVGDYDVVPRLNTFLEEHPDGAYKGARGLIAMTGYNGTFGYRTDVAYKTGEKLTADQQQWLDAHPDFNWDNEVGEATKIANAIKESGWEFASHTWGHLSVTGKSAADLQVDNEKWVNTVENIVGDVDTIIFAHGNDVGDWRDYSADNEQFNYYKSAGYNFFCNVDGSAPYWVQIRDNYVRQGRINLDGYMLYKASQGQTDVTNSMFNASEVFDSRRPTPVTANGKS